MENRNLLVAAVLVFAIILGGVVIYDQFNKGNLGSQRDQDNWLWSNDWGHNNGVVQPPVTPPEEEEEEQSSQRPEGQITAKTYAESLEMAKKYNMKAIVFFSADWCTWCKKMKKEAFQDSEVKKLLQNYVMLPVNTDDNKELARQFKVSGIPALFKIEVQNDEPKILAQANYMDTQKFRKWLSD